jgi:hypothetical protein
MTAPDLSHIAEPLRALAVEIGTIKPDPNNARRHDEHSIEQAMASLKRFGQRETLVVRRDTMTVSAGNARLEAARRLGWTHVAAAVLDDDEQTARGFAIADNRVAELSGWDESRLGATMTTLRDAGQASVPGYTAAEMDQIIAASRPAAPRPKAARSTAAREERETPGPQPQPEKPTLRTGSVVTMGDHRLVIGSPSHRGTYQALMGEDLARLLVSDPPQQNRLQVNADGDTEPAATVLALAIALAAEHSAAGACWYLTAPPGPAFIDTASELGDIWRQTLALISQKLDLGHEDHHYRHRPILYGWKPGADRREPPDRKQTSTWELSPRIGEPDGATPVEFYAKAIRNSAARGDLVLDPFAGAGGVFIAAEQLGARALGITPSPGEAEAIVARWQALTRSTAQATTAGQTTAIHPG